MGTETQTYHDSKTEGHHQSRGTGGQLASLEKRLTAAQQVRRVERMNHRSSVSREHAITRGYVNGILSVLRRGFFGRLKWLLLGR